MLEVFRERGGDPDRPGKRHPSTRCCGAPPARASRAGTSDLGPGRPGWHVECAAIALNRLGPAHRPQRAAGSDLAFPHHECGAAHAEAFTGQHPFAGHYTHAGMIGLDGEKMSKSRRQPGVRLKLRSQGVDPNALRLALFAGHYRTDRPWTADLLDTAGHRLTRWREAVALPAAAPADDLVAGPAHPPRRRPGHPRALAAVDAWATAALERRGTDAAAPALARDAVDALLGVGL
jgi:L-cysteine:1D-myo-inositol 2-amino-2-deoxy-alpha-D-glucopyranoside ligase